MAAPRGLTFEAWCYHRQIREVTGLARADSVRLKDAGRSNSRSSSELKKKDPSRLNDRYCVLPL